MKPSVILMLALALGLSLNHGALAQTNPTPAGDLQWHAFPDTAKFQVLGLPWFAQNQPKLYRMPVAQMNTLPKGVQGRAKCPSGGRILFRCNTTRLLLRLEAENTNSLKGFDLYLDGKAVSFPDIAKEDRGSNPVLFQGLEKKTREIVLYLPHLREVVVTAIGVDPDTQFGKPERTFAKPLPVLYYGSSVCQGSGAVHSGMTYEAILGRELNIDFINLGFGGAGKAEPEVVALVNSIPACAYVFDLGKSYGMQDAAPFQAMLEAVRKSHPAAPIIVMTPITSVKEVKDQAYSERSVHVRSVMRDAANALVKGGDKNLFILEGEDLLGFKEHATLSKDGVHPADAGFELIAGKLRPTLKKALGL